MSLHMTMQVSISATLVGLLLVSGCPSKANPNYCPGANANDNCHEADGGPLACKSSADCGAPTAVCDVDGTGVCVQCTPAEATACSGTTPVCHGTTCGGCAAHAECRTSGVCLPDGACADGATVAYVDPAGTDNTSCTQALPCTKLSNALATGRPYVKLTGTTDEGVTVDSGRAVTFLAAPGAKLTRTMGNGAIVTVRDTGTTLVIYDLSISDAPNNPSGIGIVVPAAAGAPSVSLVRAKLTNNPGGGISSNGGTLTVTQSTLSGNAGGGITATGGTLTVMQSTLSGNAGGGIAVSGAQFDLTNNFIAGNGGPATAFGGVRIDQANAGLRKFAFNTVTNNSGAAGATTGVVCTLVTQLITLSDSIVYDNQVGGGRTQVGGLNCSWTYSDIGPDTAAGTGNLNIDPMFVNAMQNNFHLRAGSPAQDKADPTATLAVDVDGDTRPQGPARDMGADEVR